MDPTTYETERRALIDAEQDQSRSFDKANITVAAGALGLTLAFIKDIVAKEGPHQPYLLYIGLAALVLGILSTLASFQVSVFALRTHREYLDALYGEEPNVAKAHQRSRQWAKGVSVLNILATIGTVIGTAAIAAFIAFNLPAEPKKMADQKASVPLEKGFVPPKAPASAPTGGGNGTASQPAKQPAAPSGPKEK